MPNSIRGYGKNATRIKRTDEEAARKMLNVLEERKQNDLPNHIYDQLKTPNSTSNAICKGLNVTPNEKNRIAMHNMVAHFKNEPWFAAKLEGVRKTE